MKEKKLADIPSDLSDEYFDSYKLLNSRVGEKNAENSFLWSVEFYFLLKRNNSPFLEDYVNILKNALDIMRIEKGIYNQTPDFSINKPTIAQDQFCSRDQLFAIFAICKDQGWDYHKEIWQEIKRQSKWGFIPRYDNVNPDNPKRYISPQDYLYLSCCVEDKPNKLSSFIVGITCLVSCSSGYKKTSGKLLSFIRLQSLMDLSIIKWFWNKCTKKINKMYSKGWSEVFSIYFPYDNHPNTLESLPLQKQDN